MKHYNINKKHAYTNTSILLIIMLLLMVAIISGCSKDVKEKESEIVHPEVGAQDLDTIQNSSMVSTGVDIKDLGNIMNGQYFFDDEENQYYSSFDNNNAAHIYKMDKSSGKTSTIFDGFGWSLVVHEDWLYFSGNAGAEIDGSYNLYRIKTDGSGLENLNTSTFYGMSFYDEWLFYIKKAA